MRYNKKILPSILLAVSVISLSTAQVFAEDTSVDPISNNPLLENGLTTDDKDSSKDSTKEDKKSSGTNAITDPISFYAETQENIVPSDNQLSLSTPPILPNLLQSVIYAEGKAENNIKTAKITYDTLALYGNPRASYGSENANPPYYSYSDLLKNVSAEDDGIGDKLSKNLKALHRQGVLKSVRERNGTLISCYFILSSMKHLKTYTVNSPTFIFWSKN